MGPTLTAMRWRTRRLFPFVGLALALLVAAASAPPPSPSLSTVENDVYARHFTLRAANHLPQLVLDDSMSAQAQAWADTLAKPGNDCNALQHSNIRAEYPGFSAAENIACVSGCPADASVAWNLWLNSPGHYVNLANPAFERIGIGVTCNESVEMYVVQFRSP